MAPELGELVAALPSDLDDASLARKQFDEILSNLGRKPVPVGRLTRFWLLGSLQAKIALAYMVWWLRRMYLRGDARQRALNEVNLNNALRLLSTMGYMRGTVMKIGQVLANYPSIVPEQFVDMLGVLHFEAPPMHYALIREHLANELGRDPEEAFASFEKEAFAAASLGQVHRATLKTGEKVAVKIQYPNIARTIHDDFKNFNATVFPMRLNRDWENLKAQWQDICTQLLQECDYEREADWLRKARPLFNEHEGIVVPRVFDSLSTRRVLTMEYLEGVHLPEYVAGDPPQEERDLHGARIFQSMSRMYYELKMMYADPHPGNYLFMPDGRLGLIDFGCCRKFSDEEWDYVMDVERLGDFDADSPALTPALVRSVELPAVEKMPQEHLSMVRDWCRWTWEPWQVEGKFDFGDEDYLKRGVSLLATMIRKGYVRSKAVNTWVNRAFVGVRTILYQMNASVDVGTILREESSCS